MKTQKLIVLLAFISLLISTASILIPHVQATLWQKTLTASMDSYVWDYTATTNYGSASTMNSGYKTGYRYAYLYFDLEAK